MHHRIYTLAPLLPGNEIEIAGDEFHHASRVARVRAGEAVELFDGKGALAAGKVTTVERDSIRVHVETALPSRESPLALTLAMAIIHLEKFELVLQKATELGVAAFIPMITDRVEVRPERYRGKAERWEKIVFEAVKQSGRGVIPAIEAPMRFEEIVRRQGTKIVFDADAPESGSAEGATQITILIGPEGGLSEEEIALAREHGSIIARLGPRRLRAETAAIAATGIIAARYGDI